MGLPTTGVRATHTNRISRSAFQYLSVLKKSRQTCEKLTELIGPLVDHTEQLVSVDQLNEGGDVHRGLRCDEQHTEGDGQLVEPVELPVLSDRLSIQYSCKCA